MESAFPSYFKEKHSLIIVKTIFDNGSISPLKPKSSERKIHLKNQRLFIKKNLKTHFNQEITVSKDNLGKPYLEEINTKISYSHSVNKIAIQLSKTILPGIDIQLVDPRVCTLADRYMNKKEILSYSSSIHHSMIVWCAKEALYKSTKGAIKSYSNDIKILDIKGDSIWATLLENQYELRVKKQGEFYLAYIL